MFVFISLHNYAITMETSLVFKKVVPHFSMAMPQLVNRQWHLKSSFTALFKSVCKLLEANDVTPLLYITGLDNGFN